MADDLNLEPSKSFNIATSGIGPGYPISIATEGFIAPILGDLIFGGSAIVQFLPSSFTASGGITLDGSGLFYVSYLHNGNGGIMTGGSATVETENEPPAYIGSGGMLLGGEALIETSIVPTVGGNLVLGGDAVTKRAFTFAGSGAITLSGDAGKIYAQTFEASGGLVFGGNGQITVSYNQSEQVAVGLIISGRGRIGGNLAELGRGGASSVRRVPRLPKTNIQVPEYNPDKYLQPMDYLKKIQDALDKAEREKLEMFKYLSKGTIQITGKGKVVAVFRDKPDGKMIIANNPPLEPIILDLPSVFKQGQTAIEIAQLEDHLLLSDLFGLGDYTIRKGNKARFVNDDKRTTGGEAKVNFVGGAGQVRLINAKRRRQQMEDDDLLLGINRKRLMSQQEKDDEELRLLGFID